MLRSFGKEREPNIIFISKWLNFGLKIHNLLVLLKKHGTSTSWRWNHKPDGIASPRALCTNWGITQWCGDCVAQLCDSWIATQSARACNSIWLVISSPACTRMLFISWETAFLAFGRGAEGKYKYWDFALTSAVLRVPIFFELEPRVCRGSWAFLGRAVRWLLLGAAIFGCGFVLALKASGAFFPAGIAVASFSRTRTEAASLGVSVEVGLGWARVWLWAWSWERALTFLAGKKMTACFACWKVNCLTDQYNCFHRKRKSSFKEKNVQLNSTFKQCDALWFKMK